MALPSPASAETFLGSLNVPLDGSKVYSAPLVAGGAYRIAASGTYTQAGGTNPVERDALYCFNFVASPPAACSPAVPVRQYLTIVRYEGDPSLIADLDALNPTTTLPYNPLHTYQETFTATSSSRLEASFKYNPTYTYSGGIRLDLYLVSLPPAPGAGGSGGGGGDAGGGSVVKFLEPAAAWGNPSPQTAMAPGDAVIATSPSIGPRERGVTVALSGDGSRQTDVFFGTPKRSKKLTGGDCVRAAVGLYGKKALKEVRGDFLFPFFEPTTEEKTSIYSEALADFTVFLIACLDLVRDLDKQAHQAAVTPAAGAARVSCKLRAVSLSVRVDRAAGRATWRTRRASRRAPVRRLRVSCQRARNGTVRVHIRTASKRVKLRNLVGPRLVVGAYRSTAASGTANVRATFTRG